MTYYFKISLWRIVKGLAYPVILILFFLIIFIIEYVNGNYSSQIIRILLIFILISSLPCLVLLIDHITEDINPELTVDLKKNRIIITTIAGVKEYNNNQLKCATIVKVFDNNRLTLMWSSFGYLRLEFKDDSVYYFSTLLFNSNKFWIWDLKTEQTFFPLISRDMKNTFYIKQ